MDTKASEVKISNIERSVRSPCSSPPVLRYGKAKILKILQAVSSEQPVSLHRVVLHSLRFCSDIHINGPSFSGLVGFLSCVWSALIWTRSLHCHPYSDSGSMCQNHTRAVLHVSYSNNCFHFQYR
ncbi:PREDICTED: uncharacterized protein LOC103362665 isoform X4 [Scomber scombrus]